MISVLITIISKNSVFNKFSLSVIPVHNSNSHDIDILFLAIFFSISNISINNYSSTLLSLSSFSSIISFFIKS